MSQRARDRMVNSALRLFQERGVAATALSDVIEHSGAPRGSLYHYFPGGKRQLVEEATRRAGELVSAAITAQRGHEDPVATIRAHIAYWRSVVGGSEFTAGCPVVAAALAGDQAPAARDEAGKAFAEWQKLLAGSFRHAGVPAKRARSLAALTVASIEGAIVMARAQRTLVPLDQVGRELEALVGLAINET